MYSRKEFTENINAATSIKSITTIYQEIASLRMNQLKDKVARTSAFLDGVAEIYNHAKSAYIDIIKSQTVKKDKVYKKEREDSIGFLKCQRAFVRRVDFECMG